MPFQPHVLSEELGYRYVEQDEVLVSVFFSNVVFIFIPVVLKDK
ncbi:hypothetical protein CGSHiR3021_01857 [Haemophilus influenzae 22.4-21]|uniref:Uncharacterized protein n=1 Tax=Haemophilus influenzae 22.4-21 TaxID=375063 RepID=A4NZ41_HAEIF|nr:hypothetical protein CGSHiR3021_01857 [Haemophilus influenzae 22.4-21]